MKNFEKEMKNFKEEIALYRAAVRAADEAEAFDHESFEDLEIEAAMLGGDLQCAFEAAGIAIKHWGDVMYG